MTETHPLAGELVTLDSPVAYRTALILQLLNLECLRDFPVEEELGKTDVSWGDTEGLPI